MGVKIYGLKIKKYLGENYTEEIEENYPNADRIFSLDFAPIEHLTKIKEGIYETEYIDIEPFRMSYITYGVFRKKICAMAHKVDCNEIWDNIDEWIGKPFVEFIDFADNEGSFDYVIAEKLYKDFEQFKKIAKDKIPGFYNEYYQYMDILKAVAENKGVIFYD